MNWNETIQQLFKDGDASSSNGKSADSESVNEGSTPSEASKVYMRDWLNVDEGSAHVALTLEPAGEKSYWNYGYLEIADCSRKINLEFDFETEEERQNRITKLNTLRSHITRLEQWLHDTPVKERPKDKS